MNPLNVLRQHCNNSPAIAGIPVPGKSQVIYQGRYYVACHMRDGSLTVQNRAGAGKRIVGVDAMKWAHAIRTAIDADEAHQLCKTVFNS